jgi:hypothetical protein
MQDVGQIAAVVVACGAAVVFALMAVRGPAPELTAPIIRRSRERDAALSMSITTG